MYNFEAHLAAPYNSETPKGLLVDLSESHSSLQSLHKTDAVTSKKRDAAEALIIPPVSSLLPDNHSDRAKPDPLMETRSGWGQHAYLKARESLTPAEFERFKDFMQAFESKNQSQAQMDGTYQQISRLLDAKDGVLPQADRMHLAMQLLMHAAHPSDIGQGLHNTCTIASLESREFERSPAQATETVVTAALTGQWTAPDGKQIKIDPKGMLAEGEERFGFERTLASQIFQLVITNDITQRLPKPVFFSGAGNDNLTYANGDPAELGGSKMLTGLPPSFVAIAGRRDFGDSNFFLIESSSVKSHHWQTSELTQFSSPEELTAILSKNKNFPLLIALDGRKLYGAQGVPDHCVKIESFDPQTGDITLSDPNFPGLTTQFDASELFEAARS